MSSYGGLYYANYINNILDSKGIEVKTPNFGPRLAHEIKRENVCGVPWDRVSWVTRRSDS